MKKQTNKNGVWKKPELFRKGWEVRIVRDVLQSQDVGGIMEAAVKVPGLTGSSLCHCVLVLKVDSTVPFFFFY